MNHLEIAIPKKGYLLAGLLLRLFLAPFLSHPFDMRIFMAVGAAVSRGITPYGQYVLQDLFAMTPHPHLYGTFLGIGYPPLWGLTTGAMHLLSSAIAPNNLYAYIFALKLPVIFGELALAVLIFNIFKDQTNERVATAALLLFIFCPFILAVGTIWGMFDVIALVFTLLSAYTLHHNWKWSSIFLSLSSILKIFPVILVPLYALFIYKSTNKIKTALSYLGLTAAITGVFTFVPMVAFKWPVENFYNAMTHHVVTSNPSYYSLAGFPYGAASPFNVFALLENVSGSSIQPPWPLIYIWIPACALIYIIFARGPSTPKVKTYGVSADFAWILQWSLLLMLTFFTTRVWVSEQNLIFLFTFFTLSVFLQHPQDLDKIELLWLLLFIFVLVHVPVIAFFWLPLPWTLNTATAFADGPLGWTRLLLMTALTLSWVGLCWHYVVKKLRWDQ